MELPKLQDLWSEIDPNRDDVRFLCINPIDEMDVMRAFWEGSEYTMMAVDAGPGGVTLIFGMRSRSTCAQ